MLINPKSLYDNNCYTITIVIHLQAIGRIIVENREWNIDLVVGATVTKLLQKAGCRA